MTRDRPDGKKKAYVRLTADHDALDVANKVSELTGPRCVANQPACVPRPYRTLDWLHLSTSPLNICVVSPSSRPVLRAPCESQPHQHHSIILFSTHFFAPFLSSSPFLTTTSTRRCSSVDPFDDPDTARCPAAPHARSPPDLARQLLPTFLRESHRRPPDSQPKCVSALIASLSSLPSSPGSVSRRQSTRLNTTPTHDGP